jgi:hypothetical protein
MTEQFSVQSPNHPYALVCRTDDNLSHRIGAQFFQSDFIAGHERTTIYAAQPSACAG